MLLSAHIPFTMANMRAPVIIEHPPSSILEIPLINEKYKPDFPLPYIETSKEEITNNIKCDDNCDAYDIYQKVDEAYKLTNDIRKIINKMYAKSISQPHLEVLKEDLTVECDYSSCNVSAIYQVKSGETSPDLLFQFVLPEKVDVIAQINGTVAATNIIPSKEKVLVERSYRSEISVVYQANFSGHLVAGENKIQIKYSQPLTGYEASYGYFTESRFIEEFDYILAPLKDWNIADDFTLNFTLTTPRKRSGPDGWRFSNLFISRSINCSFPTKGDVRSNDGKIVYSYVAGKDFPDILNCRMGDNDLI